ncbi:SDR family NAD(P)-dependent oxidoreductase [Noviherbaspirillum sedimenti]|uniref:Glucose 1-dehydrogenase n=1 Tax=Noviherbaspirillum sedimenti TaxID=2320865 RepID=A0A3A3G956_9BURK|nr:glucose 1-dehydrogenase [Noviherbaspirillum sedimenti]RJG03102.1 glucose 1-dehydrogenase [Noviherbaspirillum sedimenti]
MDLELQDKVAFVTGGGSGIGRAACLIFAREGAKVAVVDFSEEAGRETVCLITAEGGDAIFVKANIRSEAEIANAVASTVTAFGGLDCAFNNAGHRGLETDVVQCTDEEWDMMMETNVTSIRRCMKYQIPAMLKRGGGAIVNTSSGAGLFARQHMVAYTTSKHAVVGITKSAAIDFGPLSIRVNALHPGATITPMLMSAAPDRDLSPIAAKIPLRRLGTAEEQADAAVWLCSARAGFVNGASIVIDGGVAAQR